MEFFLTIFDSQAFSLEILHKPFRRFDLEEKEFEAVFLLSAAAALYREIELEFDINTADLVRENQPARNGKIVDEIQKQEVLGCETPCAFFEIHFD